MLAPYFSYEEAAAHFGAVHRVFGASNVSKMLLHHPLHDRGEAAAMISYDALARVDPVYGCLSHIYALHYQVAVLKEEIENIGRQMEVDTSAGSVHSFAPYSINEACCSHIEVHFPENKHQLCFESGAFEKLLHEQ